MPPVTSHVPWLSSSTLVTIVTFGERTTPA
jgi:hypothetical protein